MFSEVQTNCAELFIDCLTNCMLEASEGRCQKEPLISQIWGSKKNVDTSEVFFLLQNEAKFVHAMFIANFASFLSYDHGLEPCLASWEKWFARQFFLSLAFCRHKCWDEQKLSVALELFCHSNSLWWIQCVFNCMNNLISSWRNWQPLETSLQLQMK